MKRISLMTVLLLSLSFTLFAATTSLKAKAKTEVYGNYNFGVGFERLVGTAEAINAFSFRLPIIEKLRVGFIFGMDDLVNNTRDFLVGPELIVNIYSVSYVSFLAQTGLYYRHGFGTAAGNGLAGNVLAGLEVTIPHVEGLKPSLMYGFSWEAIGGQNNFGIPNTWYGILGFHYYF